jgi:hypothetical protein
MTVAISVGLAAVEFVETALIPPSFYCAHLPQYRVIGEKSRFHSSTLKKAKQKRKVVLTPDFNSYRGNRCV